MADDKGQAPAAAPQPAGTPETPKPDAQASATVNIGPAAETPAKPKVPRASASLRANPEDRMPTIHIHNNIPPTPPAPQAQTEVKRDGGGWGVGNILLGALLIVLVLMAGMFFWGHRGSNFLFGSPVMTTAAPPPVASVPLAPSQPTNLCDDKCRSQMVVAQCGPHRKVQFEHWPWEYEQFRETLKTVCPPLPPAPVKAKVAPPPAPMPVAAAPTDPCSGNQGTRLILHAWQYGRFSPGLQGRIDAVHVVEAATSRDSKTKSTASVARDVGAEMRQHPAAHRMIPMQVRVTLRSTGQVVATATTSNGIATVDIPRQYDGQELYVNWPQDAGFYNPPGGISRLIPGRDVSQCINIHSIYR